MLPDPQSVVWDDWLLLAVQVLGLAFLIIYVIKTWQMASATRAAAEASTLALNHDIEARQEALAPRILVYFHGSSMLAEIVIENAGVGTAENLRLEFEPPLQSTQPKESLKFFNMVQSVVPSGYKQTQAFDAWATYLDSDLPRQYRVTARYSGAENRREYEVTYLLEVESVRYRLLQVSDSERLCEEIKKSRESIERGVRRLREDFLPLLRLLTMVEPTGPTITHAVRDLIGTWMLVMNVEKSTHGYYPFKTMHDLMRVQLLGTARYLTEGGVSSDQKEAISSLMMLMFSFDAEVGRGEEWTTKRNQAFRRLLDAFPRLSHAGIPPLSE